MTGLSSRNLKYMRAFAEAWPDRAIVQQVAAQIPWFHNCILLEKVDSPETRIWYARKTVEHGWSRNILTLQIDTQLHRRQGRAVNNFPAAMPLPESDLAARIFKDASVRVDDFQRHTTTMTQPLPAPLDPTAAQRPPRKRWRKRKIAAVLLLALITTLAWRWYTPPLRVSPETTVITSPLLPDGRPDYVAYLNEKFSEGVTPENNAAVAVARLAGGPGVPAELRGSYFRLRGNSAPKVFQKEYFQLLGIAVPEDDERIILWREYAQLAGIPADRSSMQQRIFHTRWLFDPEQHPDIALYMSTNRAALDRFVEGLNRDRFFSPIITGPGEGLKSISFATVTSFPDEAVRVLLLRARQRFVTGELDGAIADIVAVWRLGRHVSQAAFRQTWQLGGAFEQYGIEACKDMILSGQFTPDQVATLRREYDRLPPPRSVKDYLTGAERLRILDMAGALRIDPHAEFSWSDTNGIQLNPKGGTRVQLRWGADVNELLRRIHADFDELASISEIGDLHKRMGAAERFQNHSDRAPPPKSSFLLAKINAYLKKPDILNLDEGNARAAFGPDAFGVDQEMRRFISRDLFQVALAIAVFRARESRFPADLADLGSETERALPLDPWTGKPFYYERVGDGFSLYSLGRNGRDDGGLFYTGENFDFDDHLYGLPTPAAQKIADELNSRQ